ncbi:hypothetical protein KC332_g9668 [Hortaea werneckii]|uniref:CCD97-like C-terminal domain-containing protein n=1 Tax=Hortaea werneckii TaxID=91943 RepID=A0A3M7IBP0_HORWE|nr:hypothetical protein KC358_g7611 [Hortaea werneckii]KAI6831518.1 hypothetical protein KC350_g7345 [Hortaea werneckii]KAI6935682.1 hypothetical protein KC341_g6745 [Hortaea werneckii]KAI6936582.1 hypothetical protein KC348_g5962 [Hortaea werneckii]KAI6970963.1 hypothetical protein KC321_g7036 [Hortaea werneckii]
MPHFAQSSHPKTRNDSALTSSVTPRESSQARADRIRIKNRRRRYLELHPEYFHGTNLEHADPLAYDRLIRQFQTAEEREQEGRQRGYTGKMEADLIRSEAKLEALRHQHEQRGPGNPGTGQHISRNADSSSNGDSSHPKMIYHRAPDGSIISVEADVEDRAVNREEGLQRWREMMSLRFLRGEDAEFDYAGLVDGEEGYDDLEEERRQGLEDWLDREEEAEFVGDGSPRGETGIQDF